MNPLLLGVLAAVVLAALMWPYVRASGSSRRRLQLLLGASALSIAVASLVGASSILFGTPRSGGVGLLVGGGLLLAAAVGGLAPRFLGLADRVFLVSIRASAVSLFVVGLLLLFVAGIGGVPERGDRGPLALALVAVATMAALGSPFWNRVVALSHAATYGDRPSPSSISAELATRLTRAVPPEEMLLQFAETIHEGLRLRSVEIWIRSEQTLTRAISLPRLPGAEVEADPAGLDVLARLGITGRAWLEVWLPALAGDQERNLRVAPAAHAGNVLAVIVLERDRSGDLFTPADDDLAMDLARRLGSLLHSQQLDRALQNTLRDLRRHAEELQASRARIVSAADEERRRLERDLHDSAQQRLVALSVGLALAADLVKEAPEEASSLLDELLEQTRETTAELRALAHGIYPPLLESGGLAAALPVAARRAGISTQVEVGDIGRLAPDIEAAIYFCCLEALQNAAKHAGNDANASIRLAKDNGGLTFEVGDDGVGFDSDVAIGGRGFTNMSDRLGAIGGTIDVESEPGEGTVVRGRIPLARLTNASANDRKTEGQHRGAAPL